MTESQSLPILVCAPNSGSAFLVRSILEEGGYPTLTQDWVGADRTDLAPIKLVVVEGSEDGQAGLNLCQRLRARQGESYAPILFVAGSSLSNARQTSLEAGADACLARPFEPAELLAQVQAFMRIKEKHDQLSEKAAEVNRIYKRLQTAYQQIDQELELARRIQLSFLPQSLPEIPRVRFAVHYGPCGRVGGDFYDVFRLDEKHLGFYVADAMGHGIPASLLTIFVKKGVRTKEITGQSYRLVPPGEVMTRLNRDLIDQSLSDNPFITMVYVLFNHETGTFQFARSGHPYPLYLPSSGSPSLLQVEGSLLGVFETQYPEKTQTLSIGDKVLLYTDGMDGAATEGQPAGLASLVAAAEHYRDLPIQDMIDRLVLELFTRTKQMDDLTLLGLEMVK